MSLAKSGKKAKKDRAKEVAGQAGDNVSGNKTLQAVLAGAMSEDSSDDSSDDTDDHDPYNDTDTDTPSNTDSSDSSDDSPSPQHKKKRAKLLDPAPSGSQPAQPKQTQITLAPSGSISIVPGATPPTPVPPVMAAPNTPFPVRPGFNIPKNQPTSASVHLPHGLPTGQQIQAPALPPAGVSQLPTHKSGKKHKKSKKSKQKENILSKLNRSGKIRKHYSIGYLLGKGASWDEFFGFFPFCQQAGIFNSDKATFHDWGYVLAKEAELEANKKKDVDDLNKKPGVLTELDLR